jgi:hypothetical protein
MLGQDDDIGDVLIYNDGTDLSIKLVSDECMLETHLHLAEPFNTFPIAKNSGNPIPGKFAYSDMHGCVNEYIYVIPIADLPPESSIGGDRIYIAVHAKYADGQSAWAAAADGFVGASFPGNNWATYFLIYVDRGE